MSLNRGTGRAHHHSYQHRVAVAPPPPSSAACRQPTSAASSSSVVDPNSVQSQFAALERERAALRRGADAASAEYKRESAALAELRSQQSSLTERIRRAHDVLGQFNKKKQMLEREKSRLDGLLASDRAEIVEIGERIGGLAEEDKSRKRRFVLDMDGHNVELDRQLERYEECVVVRSYVTEKSVRALLDGKVRSEVQFEESRREDNSNGSTSLPQCNGEEGGGSWTGLARSLEEGLAVLVESDAKLADDQRAARELEAEIHALRAEVLNQGRPDGELMGEMQLNELEAMWDQSETQAYDEYGREGLPAGDDDRSHHPSVADGPPQKQQPVNMGLFYGSSTEEHQHHPHDASAVAADGSYPNDAFDCHGENEAGRIEAEAMSCEAPHTEDGGALGPTAMAEAEDMPSHAMEHHEERGCQGMGAMISSGLAVGNESLQ